eukprot:8077441-Pyramimonas_sp.AAC.1
MAPVRIILTKLLKGSFVAGSRVALSWEFSQALRARLRHGPFADLFAMLPHQWDCPVSRRASLLELV